MAKKRLAWIDILKGLCISFIVLFHIEFFFWKQSGIGIYLNNFTSLPKVSMFFLLSGYTMDCKKINLPKEYLKKIVNSIYTKILIFSFFAVGVHNLFISIGFYELGTTYHDKLMYIYSANDIIKKLILSVFCANREPIIGPMWFLSVLFIAHIMLLINNTTVNFIFKKRSAEQKRIIRLSLSIFAMCISLLLTECFDFTIPRGSNSVTAMFAIDLGDYLFKKYETRFSENNFAVIISGFVLIVIPFFYGFVFVNNSLVNPIVFVLCLMSMHIFLPFVSMKMEKLAIGKYFAIIGRDSLYIMVFHLLSFKLTEFFLNKFLGASFYLGSLTPEANNALQVFIFYMGGVLLPVIASIFFRKIGCICYEQRKYKNQ